MCDGPLLPAPQTHRSRRRPLAQAVSDAGLEAGRARIRIRVRAMGARWGELFILTGYRKDNPFVRSTISQVLAIEWDNGFTEGALRGEIEDAP